MGIQAQTNTILVSGQVLNEKDKKPLAGVSVFRKRTGEGLATDEQGKFRISMSASDTLVFRAIGFHEKIYVPSLRSVTELRVNILLQEGSVQLQTVEIRPGLNPETVDRVLRNMKPRPAPPKPRMNPTVPVIIIPPGPAPEPDLLTSPFDYFSRDAKQRRRIAKLMAERELEFMLRQEELKRDSIRQARLRYNRFFRDTVTFRE